MCILFLYSFQVVPFRGLVQAHALLQDANAFSNGPHVVQNIISLTKSFERVTIPGVTVAHIGIYLQASYLHQ